MLNLINIYVLIFCTCVVASPAALEARQNDKVVGYECGEKFFTLQHVGDALFVAGYNFRKGSNYPMAYRGKLYRKDSRYMIWPLKEGGSDFNPQHGIKESHLMKITALTKFQTDTAGPYHIVFNKSFELIDVIALMKNHHFIKCSKVDRSQPARSSTPAPWEGDGYQCGHRFFHYTELVKVITNRHSDLSQYTGSLFGQGDDHLMLLIASLSKSEKKLGDKNPFRIVIRGKMAIVSMVAEIIDSNFVKCQRLWSQEAAKSGYQCGNVFFEIGFLRENLKRARVQTFARSITPFPQNVIEGLPHTFWPVSNVDYVILRTINWPYWLALTENHDAIEPIIFDGRDIKDCKKRTIDAKSYYNQKGVNCDGMIFWEEELIRAAQLGCALDQYQVPLVEEVTGIIPKRFTHPISPGISIVSGLAYYFVVYNSNCEVEGAMSRIRTLNLSKCQEI